MRRRRRRFARTAITATGTMLVLALAGCTPPGFDRAVTPYTPPEITTKVGTEPVTLTLYDGAGLRAVDEALIAAFQERYPNITVETRYDPDAVQAVNAPRVIGSSSPPDIARVIALSDIAGYGLLSPLDPWAEAYGWDELPEGQLSMYRVDERGVRGEGTQYSLASGFTVTGFFYNRTLLERLGASEPPTTLAAFDELLAAAAGAGITPLIAGNQIGQVTFLLQYLLNDALGVEAVNDWVYGVPGATIDTPQALAAVQVLERWIDAGYLNADTNGTDNTDAVARFAAGEALFYGSGNWDAAFLSAQLGPDVGFMLPPTDGRRVAAQSDPVSNFAIPANARHPNEAAAFLNFLLSDQARQIMADLGFGPSGAGAPVDAAAGSLSGQILEAFSLLVADDGQAQFVQNATNGANATWVAQVQLLAAGRTDAAALLASVQGKYEEELGR